MPHVGHGNIKLGAFIQLGTELPYKTRVYQAAPVELRKCFQRRDFIPRCLAEFGIDQIGFSNPPGGIAHSPGQCPARDGGSADRIDIRP